MKRIGMLGTVLLIAVMMVLVGYLILTPPKPEAPPSPNGYDDFVAGGEMVTGEIPDYSTATVEERRAFVSTNQSAMQRGRLGLTEQCRVPSRYSASWLQAHFLEMMAVKKLAGAFCVEGDMAKLDRHPSDAAACYLDAMKMGAMCVHGGVMIDGLIGTAIQASGERRLDSLLENLDSRQSRKLILDLEKTEIEQESFSNIIKNEKLWVRGQLTSAQGIKDYFSEALVKRSLRTTTASQEAFVTQYESRLQWELQLKAKVAVHIYTLEKGHAPTSWNDLVPGYLKTVPNVPFGPGDTNQLKFQESLTTAPWF